MTFQRFENYQLATHIRVWYVRGCAWQQKASFMVSKIHEFTSEILNQSTTYTLYSTAHTLYSTAQCVYMQL